MGKGLLIIFKVHFCYLNILNVLKCCFLLNAVCVKLTPPFQFFYLERVLIARGQLQPNKTGHPGEEHAFYRSALVGTCHPAGPL